MSAQYLGPVLSLDGAFTANDQNLIFARNGTGKSFLSRALRYLDLHAQGVDVSEAPINLISEETPDGKGEFTISRGGLLMGAIKLCKNTGTVSVPKTDTIFHVFSEDFVEQELRQNSYEIDGEIENQIAVDSDNIKIKDAEKALALAEQRKTESIKELQDKFEKNRDSELQNKCGVNKQLKEYKSLNLSELMLRISVKPEKPDYELKQVIRDLDSLKSIPSEPVYPETLQLMSVDDVDVVILNQALEQITSPSSVSEKIKQKIEAHHHFFETGKKIIQEEGLETCPFCEQGIVNAGAKAIVDAYIKYFDDEEEKHKSKLRGYYKTLKGKDEVLTQLETLIARQKKKYDNLKSLIPSQKDSELLDCEEDFQNIRKIISFYLNAIEDKARSLSTPYSIEETSLSNAVNFLCEKIEKNNAKVNELSKTVEKSDDERKALQRKACEVFEIEFAIDNWNDVENCKGLFEEHKTKELELSTLEKAAPSTDAKARVADTFELLIKEFFADKYIFDKENFVLKRGEVEMARGIHRTLSDGEKTAIAFCYFIACTHRKVATNSDYKKLFLVFDDPVTSMSYDYVFSIAQTLKYMTISETGEISINPANTNADNYARPELLILTHSTYFFNIALSNMVVGRKSAFALHSEGMTHKLSQMTNYVAPFQQQLKHVYEVANGQDPDHSTCNAVRSVLEAVGRFCRPDKTTNLSEFISYLASEDDIAIKSVLINSLCHGSYYDEIPAPDDLRLACAEVLQVVERYAIGQLEIVRSNTDVSPSLIKAVA